MAGRARAGGRKTITQENGISAKFDDTEYKEGGGRYEGPAPAPGLYPTKLVDVEAHDTSDTAIRWTFDITDGKYAGWRDWVYSDLDRSKWKTQNILVALGVMEPEGEVNHTYDQIKKAAEPFRARITNEIYNEETKGRISAFLKGLGTTAAAADDDEPDEDFDDDEKPAPKPARRSRAKAAPEEDEDQDDEEEATPAPKTRARRGAKKDPEPEPEDDEEEAEEGIDLDALEEELEDMSLADLKKKAKEFGAKVAELRGLDEEELVDLIMDKAEEQNPSF